LRVGPWLVVSDPVPQSLDAIFTFAGETSRIVYSKKLFMHYHTTQWVLSYPSKKITIPLFKEGLDTSKIRVVDTCHNTLAEVAFVMQWADSVSRQTHQSIRIGLVSTPFHMRRIKLLVDKKAKAYPDISVTYLPVPFEDYGWTKKTIQNWWKYKQIRKPMILELKKLVYYFFVQK